MPARVWRPVPVPSDLQVAVAVSAPDLKGSGVRPLDAALHPAEAEWSAGWPPQRRDQWSIGRRLIRHVLQDLCGVESGSPVLSDSRGAPVPSPPMGWFMSLAHDGDIFVAAASRHPVGIDVVDDARIDQVARVVQRAFDTGRASPPILPADTISCLGMTPGVACWTAWEALGKESGRGLSAGIVRWPWETGAAGGDPSDMLTMFVRRPDGARIRLDWCRVPGAGVGLAVRVSNRTSEKIDARLE